MNPRHTEIQALVGRLNNLHEIFRVQGEILSCGEDAVEPLAKLLLSPPSPFPEPRVAAAECLGAIGGDKAVNALVRVLNYHDVRSLGPVQRFAEETVRNTAARKLARFASPTVCDSLFSALQRDHLIGAGQALAQLGDTRAIPYLIGWLEDDVKKGKATEALRSFGNMAVPYLLDGLLRPRFVNAMEPPLSQERRARVAELLGQLRVKEALPPLESCLYDNSGQVRIACALALAELEGAEMREAVPQLIAGLDDPDLLVRVNCEEALQKIDKAGVSLLAQAAAGWPLRLARGDEIQPTLRARTRSVRILEKIAAAETVPYLVSLLSDRAESIRYASARALGGFSSDQALAALERSARQDPSKHVREVARTILRGHGSRRRFLALPEWLRYGVWRLSAIWGRSSAQIDIDKGKRAV